MRIIRVECPACAQPIEFDEMDAAKEMSCPNCAAGFVPDRSCSELTNEGRARWADRINVFAAAGLICGPLVLKAAIELERYWRPDISGAIYWVMMGAALVSLIGGLRTAWVLRLWGGAGITICLGLVLMVSAWLYFESHLGTILVGGFLAVIGTMFRLEQR